MPDKVKELAYSRDSKLGQDKRTKKPTTIKKLKHVLSSIGNSWRSKHAIKDKKGKVTKTMHVPPRTCADILEDVMDFARIVDDVHSRKQRSTAPLMFFDKEEKIYIHDNSELMDLINSLEKYIDERGAKRILYWLYREAPFKQRTQSKNLVAVGNGVYDLEKRRLISNYFPNDHNDFVFTTKVTTDYVDTPIEPEFDGWKLSKWIKNDVCENNVKKEKLFYQAIYCAINPNDNKKGALLLVDDGKGNTGKGTVQQLITNLVGADNRANLKLNQFENGFLVTSAVNSSLIVGDDNNPRDYIEDSSNLKSIIAKENILYNPKNEAPFSATITAFIVESMNGMPRFKDTTPANFDRFRALKFNKRYGDAEVNPDVKDKYIYDKRVLEWLLNKALHVSSFRRMIKTEESNQIINGACVESDPILEFVQDYLDEFSSRKIPVRALFNIYRTIYQYENGKKSTISQRAFTSRIKPLMAQKGWKYRKDSRIGQNSWNEKDKDHFMHKYDVSYLRGQGNGYMYPFTVEPDDRGYFENTEYVEKSSDIVTKKGKKPITPTHRLMSLV